MAEDCSTMGRWLWKTGETIVAPGIIVFVLIPSHYENEFVNSLYATSRSLPFAC